MSFNFENVSASFKIYNVFRPWLQRWFKRRIPKQRSHILQHRNIFILPTRAGLGFVLLFILLWLLGINYQNNLVLGFAFLLLALMIICIHHTYGNLSALSINVLRTHPGFVGQLAQVDICIQRESKRIYEAIEFCWPGADPTYSDLISDQQSQLTVSVPIAHRGWFQPPRLKVKTTYPLGLLVAWTQLDLDAPILAYPNPASSQIRPTKQLLDDANDLYHEPLVTGHEEFAGLREYQSGDTPRRIDWRALARGQGLATRIYEDYVSQYLWLDWQQFEGFPREVRLSKLCASVLCQSKSSVEYGLRLPGIEILPGKGEQHQEKLLKALALFEWQDELL